MNINTTLTYLHFSRFSESFAITKYVSTHLLRRSPERRLKSATSAAAHLGRAYFLRDTDERYVARFPVNILEKFIETNRGTRMEWTRTVWTALRKQVLRWDWSRLSFLTRGRDDMMGRA